MESDSDVSFCTTEAEGCELQNYNEAGWFLANAANFAPVTPNLQAKSRHQHS